MTSLVKKIENLENWNQIFTFNKREALIKFENQADENNIHNSEYREVDYPRRCSFRNTPNLVHHDDQERTDADQEDCGKYCADHVVPKVFTILKARFF